MNIKYILIVGVVQTAPFSYTDQNTVMLFRSGSCLAVDYIAPETVPYYSDCQPLVSGFGCSLVELVVFQRRSSWQIKVVITGAEGVGIVECSKIHRALLPRFEALLNTQDMYVEVTSPGLDRVIKNAYEFSIFQGKTVKVWNIEISDWLSGKIEASDSTSVTLSTDTGTIVVPFQNIAKAKLSSSLT